MPNSTTASIVALAHVLIGAVALVVLLCLHDIDQTTGAALLAGVLGLGVGGSLVAVLPSSANQAPTSSAPVTNTGTAGTV